MVRSALALSLLLAFTGVTLGVRTVVQLRRHGDSGWRFLRPSDIAALTHALLVGGALLLVAGPLAALVMGAPDRPVGWHGLAAPATAGWVSLVAGVTACVVGALVTLVAQMQMGASWRIGVDPGERTRLVTGGLFRHVRNPIFTGMGLFALGEALLVPNLVLLGALVAGTAGLQSQVRVVEEPYLAAAHGNAYRGWAARRGRFVPGLGKQIRRPANT